MKVIRNEELIKRNVKAGQWTSLIGIFLLAGSMIVMIWYQQYTNYALIAVVVGFILSIVSSGLGTRFGGTPRPDETLDAALKGLPGEFTMYHFTTPAAHLLVGPAGIWALLPYRQVGRVEYTSNKWRLSGGGFMHGYMRFFGQDRLGRPAAEAESDVKSVQKYLAKEWGTEEVPSVNAMLVFTHPEIELEAGDSQIPALRSKQIKEFFRQRARESSLSPDLLQKVKATFE